MEFLATAEKWRVDRAVPGLLATLVEEPVWAEVLDLMSVPEEDNLRVLVESKDPMEILRAQGGYSSIRLFKRQLSDIIEDVRVESRALRGEIDERNDEYREHFG